MTEEQEWEEKSQPMRKKEEEEKGKRGNRALKTTVNVKSSLHAFYK